MKRFVASAVLAVLAAQAVAALPAEMPPSQVWQFDVLLDGKPIGRHRFGLTRHGDGYTLVSEADFNVKFLGVTAYRYRHKATELWHRGCLDGLTSRTDDDGAISNVRLERESAALVLKVGDTTQPVQGCLLSFAYWNPVMRQQSTLLNVQTGKRETVRIEQAGDGEVEVAGKPVPAARWRISGPQQPIDVWYSPQGEWVALDTVVQGGRKLSYRLARPLENKP